MTRQLNLTGYFQLAEHQRRISGTDIGVGEYVAPPPQPKGMSSRDLVTFRLKNGVLETVTPAKRERARRQHRALTRDPYNRRINELSKAAKKLCR